MFFWSKRDISTSAPSTGNNAETALTNETTGLLPQTESTQSQAYEDDVTGYNIPQQSLIYKFFMLFSFLAFMVSGLMIMVQIFTLIAVHSIFFHKTLQVYIIIISIMFMLTEWRVEGFLIYVPPLRNWVYRGFLYSFVGIIGIEMSIASLAAKYPQPPTARQQLSSSLLGITSYVMVGVGFVYMLMGIMCLKSVSERIKRHYDEQVARSKAQQYYSVQI